MAEQKKYIDLPGLLYYNQGLNTNVLQDIRDQITGLGDADNEFISQLGNINTSIVGINNSLKTKLDNTTLYAASPSTGGPATKALSIIDYNSADSNVIDCKISKTPIEKTTGVLGLYLEDKNTVKFNLTDTLDFKNGSITAKTLIGNLTGDVTGTADNAKNLKMNFAGQDNAARNIWINTYANASDTTGNLSVSSTSKFAFNPSTNKLTIGSGSLTGEEYSGKSKTAGTADYATKIGTVDSNYTKSSLDKEFEKYQPLLPKLDNQQNKVLKVNSSGKLEWMTDELGPNNIYSAGEGLDKSTDGTDSGEFKVNFGGDGSATTVSRSDHSHSNYLRNNADDTFTGKLTVEGSISTTKDVTIGGNLTVNGETTTLNVTNLNVEDKLISLGYTPSPSITTGSNGGIQVITKKDASIFKGPSIKWVSSGKNSTSGWKISSDDSAAPSNLIVAGDIYVNTDKKVWSLDNLPAPGTSNQGKVLKANSDGTVSWQTDADTNTWRGITNDYNGEGAEISLSQKGAKALYDALNNGYATSAGTADYATKIGTANSNYTKSTLDSTFLKKGSSGNVLKDNGETLTVGNGSSYDIASGGHTHSYLPLTGGTLTGPLTIPGDRYYASSSIYGIDMQNSDIIGINSIYTSDASEDTEGIFFARTNGNYDRISARDGILQFKVDTNKSGSTGTLKKVSFEGHTHDDRYYTESEINSKLNEKANTNQTMYIGTTSIAINRSSSSQNLTGVNIDGQAGSIKTESASSNVDRPIFFNYSNDSSRSKIVYNDNFQYNPDANHCELSIGKGESHASIKLTNHSYINYDSTEEAIVFNFV